MDITLDNYKLSCEMIGHSMDVRSVNVGPVSPEGQLIISGSRDKTAKVWKRSGDEYSVLVTLQDHKNFISCVFYLENEQWICTGSNDATICIYEINGCVPIHVLEGHESNVCAIASGVEASSLITGSWDKTARIWSIDKMGGYSFKSLIGHEGAVWAVASMPLSKKFITGSADKTILYWNDKGDKLKVLKGHTDCVRGVLTLSNCLVSCGNDAIIRYWNSDGECVQQLSGHSNYIYDIAQIKSIDRNIIVSCGEDSTLRMWNLTTGSELGAPKVIPAQSVWSVECLSNGDIVTGSSDGVIRVFTKDPTRVANTSIQNAFEIAVKARLNQMNEELGGIKKTELPGPESLLIDGSREGQIKMVRHSDGSVKCYNWEKGNWNLIGDITGASGGPQSSGRKMHEGKEYDFVFSVDISETEPSIKLPYNRGEDPWRAAQAFIHNHNLPQAYLEQVANFIIKNSEGSSVEIAQPTSSGYQDPFTGGSRYVPGSSNSEFNVSGSVDTFTSESNCITSGNQQQRKFGVDYVKGSEKHFPVSKYVTIDNCDPIKVLDKLKEFNNKLSNPSEKVSDLLLENVIKLTDSTQDIEKNAIEALQHLLRWPSDLLFPVLDVTRLALRNEAIFTMLNSYNFFDDILPKIRSSVPNQLMIIRCLTNMMRHETGRKQIDKRLAQLVQVITTIKSGSANLQIAIATFYLNLTVEQCFGLANGEKCRILTEGIVEFFIWSIDLEACYRAMQSIGNLISTPYAEETVAQVISVEYVIDKIRDLSNKPQPKAFEKLNAAGSALLASFR